MKLPSLRELYKELDEDASTTSSIAGYNGPLGKGGSKGVFAKDIRDREKKFPRKQGKKDLFASDQKEIFPKEYRKWKVESKIN